MNINYKNNKCTNLLHKPVINMIIHKILIIIFNRPINNTNIYQLNNHKYQYSNKRVCLYYNKDM